MIDRIIWIILDSVGMGELPDAHKFGDQGSNTIGNISKMVGGLNVPNLVSLGLGNIEGMIGLPKTEKPLGCFGRFGEISNGKDTVTGHWEMAGVFSEKPFPTYPNGFPKEIIEAFEKAIGTKTLGNKPASGTEILEELGEEHLRTGYPIVYTSADSVFQIAAHEEVIPIEKLYEICSIARDLLVGEHAVARVIARPFIGKKAGSFTRTPNRRDYALAPPHDTILDKIKDKNLDVIAVGKIEDIFSGRGITEAVHTQDNMDGVNKTIQYMKQNNRGLIFTNLVDFDMKWGHRNDYKAYAQGLEEFDKRLPEILDAMGENDVLMINADHGCDPTTPSTDHSREYVPFIAYGKKLNQNVDLKTRRTFADIGQTIGEILGTDRIKNGESFAKEILKKN
ncbi:MAG: phosphopentomutase [Epulopiscium sp.]|jgi:phosphopentomutase|uniref:Phosphopentomutase n=1 Tax=Defluviitalea raffinosedens TaxID=1450156 RepID=A0A7C8LFH8_9FIRM|nr:phosphopentomutase [Defluviitalea raffinosedens]MBZ4667890.1 phosphopentomutase [Defluviitaleaceae bacterium]MDK2788898.1 phosphopentomutase [Candidatus Epulonipiscium sp.]KAE9629832.1 phosphopentomutase [Defluviitalea raffinosedens]MBM7686630.1 phosphopentomutase [Defluviitalea raffinosedens]HHW67887.1 phosphopentomutase [Candidatus Epulonipiscium sp.]